MSATETATVPSEDITRAAEIAQRFCGWHVWSVGQTRVATRNGNPRIPRKDPVWAKSLIADTWDDLERQLARQARNDAERG